MLLNKLTVVFLKKKKIFFIAQFICVLCVMCFFCNLSAVTNENKIENIIESNTPKTRQELRDFLIEIFPSSYILEYRLAKDIITCSIDTLDAKLASAKNTDNAVGSWSGIKTIEVPVWGNVSIYQGKRVIYKYYPRSSWKNIIATLGVDSGLLLEHRVGVMINYTVSKANIKNPLYGQNKASNPTVEKTVKEIENQGFILALYYQYLNTKFSVGGSVVFGELKQKRKKKIMWLQADYRLYYKPRLYNINFNLSYPCNINKICLDIILNNNFSIIKNPDVSIKEMSTIEHSSIQLFRTGTAIRTSYNFQLPFKINIYSAIMLAYNYNFYLEGKSALDITYLGKDFDIKNYQLEKHSFNANLDIITTFMRSFNVGINLTWLKERYSSSLGGRLLFYYCF